MKKVQPGTSPAARSTYDKIMNVAAECMLQNGYRDTRMTVVADMSGISRAALYKYFPTKDSLLLELNRKVLEEAQEDSRRLSASKAPALEVIREWLLKYLNTEQAGFVRAVMIDDAQQVLIQGQEATEATLNDVKKALVKVLRRGIKSGEIRDDIKPADTAHMLQGVVFSVKRNYLSTRPVIDLREQKYRTLLVETISAGLRSGNRD
ncbi:TetR/AcrR family transcriptional regulator [Litorivivens sp.]|uniref:TetR/AcrR family transcriptional regulator n=1 Tax=Litorivivens sp. TaxID=2020868 RepID=UPI0035659C65